MWAARELGPGDDPAELVELMASWAAADTDGLTQCQPVDNRVPSLPEVADHLHAEKSIALLGLHDGSPSYYVAFRSSGQMAGTVWRWCVDPTTTVDAAIVHVWNEIVHRCRVNPVAGDTLPAAKAQIRRALGPLRPITFRRFDG